MVSLGDGNYVRLANIIAVEADTVDSEEGVVDGSKVSISIDNSDKLRYYGSRLDPREIIDRMSHVHDALRPPFTGTMPV